MSAVSFDDMIELLCELDAYMAAMPKTLRVQRHFTAPTFDGKARSRSTEGFVEGELLVPWGVSITQGRVYFRFKNPADEPGETEWGFVDLTNVQVDDHVSAGLYSGMARLVAGSGLFDHLKHLITAVEERVKYKPALCASAERKLERSRLIRTGVKSQAEERAKEDFYNQPGYGEF